MRPVRSDQKTYLGDGVYVRSLDYGFELTAENGIAVTNRIVLEPNVYAALASWVKAVSERALGPGLP